MDDPIFIFVVILAGVLLGMACKAMCPADEGKVDTAQADLSPAQPVAFEVSPSEAPLLAAADLNAKDCKSCGAHSVTGAVCSFCGRAL